MFFGNTLPESVIIFFVDQLAYNGDKSKNPFDFKSLSFNEASLVVNSFNEPSYPYKSTQASKKRLDLYFEVSTLFQHSNLHLCYFFVLLLVLEEYRGKFC